MTSKLEQIFIEQNVSRETFEKFIALLLQWNEKVNLIANSTIDSIWQRHIEDSAQLINLIPNKQISLIDVGSGAGFPGLILSFLGVKEVHLIESDGRKVAFLKAAAELTSNKTVIHQGRIENLLPWKSDVITARAVAPLHKLIHLTYDFIMQSKHILFLKGENYQIEIDQAQHKWDFDYNLYPSITNDQARIISIKNLQTQKS
jgi:16S rRNA (guanine527-N7)-methyltransferase